MVYKALLQGPKTFVNLQATTGTTAGSLRRTLYDLMNRGQIEKIKIHYHVNQKTDEKNP